MTGLRRRVARIEQAIAPDKPEPDGHDDDRERWRAKAIRVLEAALERDARRQRQKDTKA